MYRDFKELLSVLSAHDVRFLVVGAYAVSVHAQPRATKDLDLLVSASGDNLDRVATALEHFGAPPNVVDAAKKLGPIEVVYLGAPPVRIDILRTADGIDDVDATLGRAVLVSVGDLPIRVLALDDLIANKRAAGRLQDLADVALLERIRSRK